MSYLSFINDKDLFKILDKVFQKYTEAYSGFDLKKFNKNIIDPFGMIFAEKFAGKSDENWIHEEAERQINKSIANVMGTFQEEILACAPNFKKYNVGDPDAYSMDLINNSYTIFADVKNKHNTLKGANKPDLFRNFERVLEKFPNGTAYYVQIIAKESFDRVWSFKAQNKKYENNKIHEISGDQFYKLVFGVDDAFYQLITNLPNIIDDYMQSHRAITEKGNMKLLGQLAYKQDNTNKSYYDIIAYDSFSSYIGFK